MDTSIQKNNSRTYQAFEIAWYVALGYIIVWSNKYYINILIYWWKNVDLSEEHFLLQAIFLGQRQFCILFHLEAPDLSGQSEPEMLRHDPICWDISHEYSLTDVLTNVLLLEIYPTVHRYYMTHSIFAQFLTKFLKKDGVYNHISSNIRYIYIYYYIRYISVRRNFLLFQC